MSDIKTISYQEKVVCNSCKGENEILQSVVSGGLVYECETRCKVCGFEDYWSHGFFSSCVGGLDNATRYSFNSGVNSE